MIHDVWVEDDTREEWVCRWVCNTCGGRGSWTDVKNRGRVQEAKLAHAKSATSTPVGDEFRGRGPQVSGVEVCARKPTRRGPRLTPST